MRKMQLQKHALKLSLSLNEIDTKKLLSDNPEAVRLIDSVKEFIRTVNEEISK